MKMQMQHTKTFGIEPKIFLRGNFISNKCVREEKRSQTKNLILHLQDPEKKSLNLVWALSPKIAEKRK